MSTSPTTATDERSIRPGSPRVQITGGGGFSEDASVEVLTALMSPVHRQTPLEVFPQALTLVYRLLFLFFAEARGLVPLWHPLYREHYSLERLCVSATDPSARGLWDTVQALGRLAHAGCRAGDLQVTDRVCMALGQPGAPVSPIHFHNIVHNATAGYWSIGAHAQAGSVSLSAGEASFAAGLLEALSIVVSEQAPVLLVSYEQPAPAIIDRHLPICAPFATAMLVSGQAPGATGWALNVERIPYCPATRMARSCAMRPPA